jgi:hypothetical protein
MYPGLQALVIEATRQGPAEFTYGNAGESIAERFAPHFLHFGARVEAERQTIEGGEKVEDQTGVAGTGVRSERSRASVFEIEPGSKPQRNRRRAEAVM